VFKFTSQGPKSKGFECSVDAGPFTPCSSPADYGRLAPGEHLFSVRALSSAGDPDETPASYRWTVFEDLVPHTQQQETTTQPTPAPQPKSQPPPVLVG
jgi:hypothetical protein